MHKHRLDALTDGIFAVAMTLLVIDLKLPESAVLEDNAALGHALAELLPKLISWLISFMVLATFWWGHSRLFHHVKSIDGKLATINVLFLGAASFMPFASSLSGGHTALFASQLVYSITMALTAWAALAMWRYVYRHPELCESPMPAHIYRGALARTSMLIATSVLACVIALRFPHAGNMAFMLMAFIGPATRWMEKRAAAPA